MQPPLAPLDGSPESVWDMDTSLYAAPPPGGLVVDAAAIQGSGGDGGGRGNNDNTSGSRKQRGFTAALVLNKVDLVEQQSRLDLINNSLKLVAGKNTGIMLDNRPICSANQRALSLPCMSPLLGSAVCTTHRGSVTCGGTLQLAQCKMCSMWCNR